MQQQSRMEGRFDSCAALQMATNKPIEGQCGKCEQHRPLVIDGPGTTSKVDGSDVKHLCQECSDAFVAEVKRIESRLESGFRIVGDTIWFSDELN